MTRSLTESGFDLFDFSVEVDGIGQCHADTQGEAVALAWRMRDTFPGRFVAVVDNRAQELVLGWWLFDAADLAGVTA